MSDLLTRGKFARPVDQEGVARAWRARGYSCGLFVDPPGQEWLVPRSGSIDPIDGPTRPFGQARRAARCGTSGKRRNAPEGPSGPTEGRPALPARRVAGRLWWAHTTAQPAPYERAKQGGQWGQYFRSSVLNFVHATNELVTVMRGRLEMTVAGQTMIAEEGDEVFIPRGAAHSLRNIHDGVSKWLYGYD